ncbi:hypothetical protein NSZ01_28510 [Nocardioides szechwanensis]|nr:hypothetical protein NSZ01_28510 [Nocardioides szechwanensis]
MRRVEPDLEVRGVVAGHGEPGAQGRTLGEPRDRGTHGHGLSVPPGGALVRSSSTGPQDPENASGGTTRG